MSSGALPAVLIINQAAKQRSELIRNGGAGGAPL
jgi:hypothetical protein